MVIDTKDSFQRGLDIIIKVKAIDSLMPLCYLWSQRFSRECVQEDGIIRRSSLWEQNDGQDKPLF